MADAISFTIVCIFILQTPHTKKSNTSSTSNNNGEHDSSSNDNLNEDDDNNYVPISTKIFLFTETVLFILLQIFVLIRLDGDTDWSWFEVCQL